MLAYDISLSDSSRPVYFKLAVDEKVIVFVGEGLDEGRYPGACTTSRFDSGAITEGIFGLALALFCDHRPFYSEEVGDPGYDIFKDENNYYASFPLFMPECGFGCCGGEDFGIHFTKDRIKIGKGEEEFMVSPDEYVDMLMQGLREIYNSDRQIGTGTMIFLLGRAAVEGREIIRRPLIRELLRFGNENHMSINPY